MIVSKFNTQITLDFLQKKRENQYFERKGLGEKDTSPTKIANELIGMLNADGGVLAFGVSNEGEFQDVNALGEKLSDYRNLYVDFIEPHGNIKLEEVDIEGKRFVDCSLIVIKDMLQNPLLGIIVSSPIQFWFV
jgi:ATP-dependent DNA helicase RecG